jgi:DNA adenine methylase
MRFCSPLRYPGGKGKLAKFIKLVFEANNLFDGHYVEPYAGGAGVAFALLFEEYASHIHINDLNKSIYTFWHVALNETENLCRMIHDTPVNMNEWERQKEIQDHPQEYSLLNLAFSTFFLNRTNRSGIIRGGVIGGRNQNGKWKIDARYNKKDLVYRIEKIAGYKERISLYNLDASGFIKSVLPALPMLSLVYLDPPYYVKGAGLYENHYCHDDHESVASIVTSKIKQMWIVSYDNTPAIRKFYKDYRQLDYGLHYSAADRYQGSEVMIFCNQLSVPPVDNPVKIKAA